VRVWHLMLLKAIGVMLAVNAAIIWPMNLEAAQTQPPTTRSSWLSEWLILSPKAALDLIKANWR
jgi:hypothetical protein